MTVVNLKLHLHECIQKVATGPEYSKDLSYDEAYHAMRYILSGDADPVRAAIYLIALRMKRETDEENRGTLQALIDASTIIQTDLAEVVDISDPYDGYGRGLPASSFVPALFAAMGVPCVLHGLDEVGPKFGVTHHKVLRALGLNPLLAPELAAKQLARIGWTYIDQAQFSPALHGLIPLRQSIIKRQILTTVEKMLAPIRGQKTHYISGYVHKAYPPIYAALARQTGFESAIFIRGVEGGVIPSLQQAGKLFCYRQKGIEQQYSVSPDEIGIVAQSRAIPLPQDTVAVGNSDLLASHVAKMGVAALSGEQGLMYDSLVYIAAIGLHHLGHYASLGSAAQAVRKVLDSGEALSVLRAAL